MSVRTRLLLSAVQLVISFATVPVLAQTAPPPARQGQGMVERFQAANTTHDGRLTLAQAQAAHMKGLVRNFSAIDAQNKGFVTLDDVRAYRRQQRAAHAAGAQTGAPP